MQRSATVKIPPNFVWNCSAGEKMNLLLNVMGGLKYENMDDEEKKLWDEMRKEVDKKENKL